MDNLSIRNIRVRSTCVFCNTHNETDLHLFVYRCALKPIGIFLEVVQLRLSLALLSHGGQFGERKELGVGIEFFGTCF